MGRTACTEPQCLCNGAPLPLPTPLLPLWVVRPVQSLSACTTVHLYLYQYLYSPYGSYGLYRASVPVQGCTFTYLHFSIIAAEELLCKFEFVHLPISLEVSATDLLIGC